MKLRFKQQQEELIKLQHFFGGFQAQRGMYPVNLSLAERIERLVTDAPFQWLWYRLIGLIAGLFTHDPPKFIEKLMSYAFTRWVYGKAINDDARLKVISLARLGFSRRDLRLAVSSRYIRGSVRKAEKGRIKINWTLERILQTSWWLLFGLLVLWVIELFVAMHQAQVPMTYTAVVGLVISGLLTLFLYPFFLLCVRAPKVVRELQAIKKQHPLLFR